MRDDFPKSVLETLAKRVGYRCSHPSCGKLTSGPHTDQGRVVNVGVAGHITAASPGGPRYDPSLTAEQRRSADNGIWLCQNCGKLVDSDEMRFPVTLLREWRQKAEGAARWEVESLQVPRHIESCRIATHIGTHETLNLAHCDFHGRPIVPDWLHATPERLSSDWLLERLGHSADLRLYFDPKWCGGIWFVADMATCDGVVINPDQLRDLKPSSPTTTTSTTTTTTTTPQPPPSLE